jgi:diguanylate cyclase (GGDEF)-like protein
VLGRSAPTETACLLVLLVLAVWLPAAAQAAQLRVERLPDADMDASFERVPFDRTDWQQAEQVVRSPLTRGGARWWRLAVDDVPPSGDWVLSIKESYDAHLTAFLPPDYAPRVLHLYDPDLEQIGSRHRLALTLTPAQRAGPIFLRIDWARSQPLSLQLMPVQDYVQQDLQRVRFSSAILSALLMLAVVGAIFATALKRRVLLLFCVWIVSTAIYEAVMSGEAMWMLGDLASAVSLLLIASIATHVGLISAYVFVYRFLSIDRHYPRLSRLFLGLLWLVALLAIVSLVTRAAPAVAQLLNLVLTVLVVLVVLALGMAVRLALRGDRQARFYVFGWGLVALAGVLRAAHFLALAGTPTWLEYAHPALNAMGALVLVLATARAARYAEREMHSARLSARTDPLTGLPNRAELDSSLPARIEAAREAGRPLSLLFIDLDHFKRINDRYGHDVGDLCLAAAATILRKHVRTSDLLARYGGEEFVLLLEGADLGAARGLAGELRAAIEREGRSVRGHAVGMTVSLGIAELAQQDDVGSLLRRADAALYRAKGEGRNCFVSDPPAQAA